MRMEEGTKLAEVNLHDAHGQSRYATGTEVQEIVVVMQFGQMGLVPWAEVRGYGGEHIALVNLANVESVVLASHTGDRNE